MWCNDPDKVWRDLECVGFNGDRYYRPFDTAGGMVPYQASVMAIDPSGRGADETSYAVVKSYGGQMFVLECGGLKGGYGPEVLQELSMIAKRQKVHQILIESNMGDGMFSSLLTPVLHKIHPASIEEVRHSIQKERRICECPGTGDELAQAGDRPQGHRERLSVYSGSTGGTGDQIPAHVSDEPDNEAQGSLEAR